MSISAQINYQSSSRIIISYTMLKNENRGQLTMIAHDWISRQQSWSYAWLPYAKHKLCKTRNGSVQLHSNQETCRWLQHHHSFQPAWMWKRQFHTDRLVVEFTKVWKRRNKQSPYIFQPNFEEANIVLVARVMPKSTHTLLIDQNKAGGISTGRECLLHPLYAPTSSIHWFNVSTKLTILHVL